MSAATAASMRACASWKNIRRGSGGSASGLGWASVSASLAAASSMPASAARCFCASRRLRSSRSLARRSELYSKTAREACAPVIRSGLSICPAPGLSSSATSPPRGSAALAAIEPARGPKPKRCNASAACALGSRAITLIHHGVDGEYIAQSAAALSIPQRHACHARIGDLTPFRSPLLEYEKCAGCDQRKAGGVVPGERLLQVTTSWMVLSSAAEYTAWP